MVSGGRLGAWGAAVSHFLAGYSVADWRMGLKMMLGWGTVLAVASVPAVWDKLSELGSSPAITLIMYASYLKDSTGATMLVACLSVAAACVAAGLGFLPIYAAFAANGGTWAGGAAAKGATLVAVSALLIAMLVVWRMRFEALDAFFYILCLLLSSFCFAAYWVLTPLGAVSLPSPPVEMSYTMLLICSLPLAVVLPMAWLVWPQPSGCQAKGCFCRLLGNLGKLSLGITELLVQQPAVAVAVDGKQPEPEEQEQQPAWQERRDGEQQGEGQPADGQQVPCNQTQQHRPEGEMQPLAALRGQAGGPHGMQADAAELQKLDEAIRQDVGNLGMLLLVSHMDLDLYGKQRVLPIQAFKRARGLTAAADAALGQMLRWVRSPPAPPGEAAAACPHGPPLNADSRSGTDLQTDAMAAPAVPAKHLAVCRQLAPQLLGMAAALQACCAALAAVVMQKLPLTKALVQLEELESRYRELGSVVGGPKHTKRAAAIFMIMRGLLGTAAAKVRAMFPEVAAAVESLQPGAQAAVAAHFEASAWRPVPGRAGSSVEEADTALEQAQMLAGAASVGAPDGGCDGLGRHSSSKSAGNTGTGVADDGYRETAEAAHTAADATAPDGAELAVYRPTAALDASASPRGMLRRAADRAGLGRLQLLPGLHMLVLIGVAGTLLVVKPVYEALGGSSDWVVITVIAASERSAGRSRVRAANRLLGTCAGIAWSMLCLGVAYGINGGSFNNSVAKYTTLAVLVSLWGGFVGLNQGRFRRISYAWTVMDITVSIVLVESFKSLEPWDPAKWRITCVCIGICLELLVTSLLFPVTTTTLLRDKAQAALGGLAALTEGVAACEAQGGEELEVGQEGQGGACVAPAGARPDCDAAAAAAAEAAKGAEEGRRQLRGPAAWQQGRGRAVESLAQLQARAQQVQATALALAAISTYSHEAPLPALAAEGRRHAAALATKEHLLHCCDALLLITYGREMRDARGQRSTLPPASRRLVVAVGEQAAECLRALCAVLSGRLPLAAALRTLPALDVLLRQLAAASGQELAAQGMRQQPPGGGGLADGEGGVAIPPRDAASLLPFTAVALGMAPTLRALYQSVVRLMMAGDAAALRAADAESRSVQPGLGSMAAAQQAAVSAAVHTLA